MRQSDILPPSYGRHVPFQSLEFFMLQNTVYRPQPVGAFRMPDRCQVVEVGRMMKQKSRQDGYRGQEVSGAT